MINNFRKTALILAAVFFAFFAIPAAADTPETLSVAVNGKTIKKISVEKGSSTELSVKYGSAEPDSESVSYTSSNKKVVRVSSSGVLKAKSSGKATVTIKYNNEKIKIKVTVKDPEVSSAGTLTCPGGSVIQSGKIISVTLDKKAKKRDWTWAFAGQCAADARILNDNYKSTGKITFTVWPSGGMLTLTGTDPSGAAISCDFTVKQTKKWKKREKYRSDALAGINSTMSQKDIVVYFADYIADRASYGPGNGNFFRVIDEGVGDCWCYSTAFKLLADAAGIETIIVKNALSTSHYWNQVNIDGIWYNVDVQGYDTGKSHRWILSSDKKHGKRWVGDSAYYAQFSIYYPVSNANKCTKSLKF